MSAQQGSISDHNDPNASLPNGAEKQNISGIHEATATHTGRNQLTFFSVTMIVVSLVIGMGIFGTPANVAASSGSVSIFFAAWLTGGVVALCGALTYAEIGVRLPVMGAYYKVFSICYHPVVGFTVNALILISNAASLGIVALIGADYVSDLLFGQPSGPLFNIMISTVAVIIFYIINMLGLHTSSIAQNILTLIKIALILLLIASILKGVVVEPHGYIEGATLYQFKDNHWLTLFLASMIPASFSYGGYQQTINFGSEIKNTPLLPRAIVVGIGTVIMLYLALNLAYTQVIGFEKMKNASAIGALLCEAWFGAVGAKIFDVFMFLSVLAYVNIVLMSNPRVMYAMSSDGVFPGVFLRKHAQTGALVPALTVFSIATIVITFFGKSVDSILGFTMFLDSIGMSTSAAALFFLKRKQPQNTVNAGWTKATPFLATIFVCAYLGIAIAVINHKPQAAVTGISLLLFLAILYYIFYYRKKK